MLSDNPFFMETLDETGGRFIEEIARDTKPPIPSGVMAQSYPTSGLDTIIESNPIEDAPVGINPRDLAMLGTDPQVGPDPYSLPQVGPEVVDNTNFTSALKGVENSIKSGYDEGTGMWSPHASLEGGTKTLGYGHKLSPREAKGNFVVIDGKRVDTKGGLTDEEIERLFNQDMSKAEDRLKKDIPNYKELDSRYQNILINIAFNVGKVKPKGWPKLLEAMKKGDDEGVRREMVTSYKNEEGERIQLTSRANAIADAVLL